MDPQTTTAPSHLSILLVEDSQDVRETTVEFIQELDHSVVAVESAELALEKLAADRFDVVMTDISLPGLSGLALIKQVQEKDARQRFVIVSGYGDDFRDRTVGGRVAVLTKPYDLATLERTLDGLASAGASSP